MAVAAFDAAFEKAATALGEIQMLLLEAPYDECIAIPECNAQLVMGENTLAEETAKAANAAAQIVVEPALILGEPRTCLFAAVGPGGPPPKVEVVPLEPAACLVCAVSFSPR